MRTSRKELIDLLKAWVAVGIAFTIVDGLTFERIFSRLALSLFLVGTAFILHELAHKLVAQKYGCMAEFRSFDKMLFAAMMMSFLGFVIAAPGAVMIYGRVSRRQNGIISMAGPLTNLVVAAISYTLMLLGAGHIAALAFSINSMIALFNMIPVMPFDGSKILYWSKPAYFAMVAVGLVFMFIISL
jgi:Zn-dependent protease